MPQIIAGTYEIIEQIGSGGGSIVYLAHHQRLDKKIVLKADRRRITAKPEALRREVDALKNISHSYIPQVYDFVTENEIVYTVMDFIEGESFDQPLRRGEHFLQSDVIRWTRQLLDALSYLHSRPPYGILHADIKPANVMLETDGNIRLIDFNIALALGEMGAVSVGRSFGYASPEHYGLNYSSRGMGNGISDTEQDAVTKIHSDATTVVDLPGEDSGSYTQGGKRILLDVRSDIYSLGATLYHIISGIRPAKEAKEVRPISPAGFNPAFLAIIAKAMNPDPDLRYQTAAAMLADINNIHKNDPRYKRFMRGRRISVVALSALFLASGFCSFAGLKRIQQTQSDLVAAEYAAGALLDGNTEMAIDYALSALPDEVDIFTTPPPPQAQKALTDALGVYDLADGYKPIGSVTLPSPPFKIEMSPSGTTAAALYAYEIALFDVETAQVLVSLPLAKSALSDAVFIGESTIVYAGSAGICAYDLSQKKELWHGKPATQIAVSANGKAIAAVDRNAQEAILYDQSSREIKTVSFHEKRQKIPANDTMGDPGDLLLALNHDGSLLAASFEDGSLDIFDVNTDEIIAVQSASDYTHFEGGFQGDHFAFSAMGVGMESIFSVYDMRDLKKTGGFTSDDPFYVSVDEGGIVLASVNLAVKLDPVTGAQKELAYTDKPIIGYHSSAKGFIASTQDNRFHVYDENATLLSSVETDATSHFVKIAGDFVLAGSRDTPAIRILRQLDYTDYDMFTYDSSYDHDEARINKASDRLMLFSYAGFRLYGSNHTLLSETAIPSPEMVTDQQYSAETGNLAVIYKDALRIYSGQDGSLLLEETGLKSTFYAPYGISIFAQDGTVKLIDLDTGATIEQRESTGDFAAICGITVDSGFLAGRELIGAAKTDSGYLFAVSDGVLGTMYDGSGKERFGFTAKGKSEVFFADNIAVISPQNGTPIAYSIETGKLIRELEPDCFMTYLAKSGGYLVSQYITADGEKFGVLLDENCGVLARLPDLTDTSGDKLRFDYKTGTIRETHVYHLDELKRMAKGGKLG